MFSRHFSRLLYVISSLVQTGLLLLLPVTIYSNGSAIFFYLNSADHIMSWLHSSDPENVVSLAQWEMWKAAKPHASWFYYDLQCNLYCDGILASSSWSTIFFIDIMFFIQICIGHVFVLVVCMWSSQLEILLGLLYTMACHLVNSKILQSISQLLVFYFTREKSLYLKNP